jgi:hypothetical protein
MIPILATDNTLRKKEWAIEFEGPASFFACRHYIYTHTQLAAFYRHTQLAPHTARAFSQVGTICVQTHSSHYTHTHTHTLAGPSELFTSSIMHDALVA